ncbi:cytochrome P450 [Streptomyces sp. 8P21H-1]|uniref:cytochrome P450 n=1 Tax=Streptomyces sp. 8P21H-1 TaxID=2737048 RepID=UPI001570DC47|nr:cytochrome P450 [Streptomyces sp. 8P21H-1]NSL43109.1 cytochrome P450 [Streptomyces sp. 8P21H-1]
MSEQTPDPLFPFDTPPSQETDPVLARLRAEDPVPRVRLATGRGARLATRYDDVRQVLSDPRLSRAANDTPRPPVPVPVSMQDTESISNLDAPEHTRIRRLIAKAFPPERTDRLSPRVAATVDGLLDGMAEQGPPADLVTMLANPLSAAVMCELFGVPGERREELRTWLDTATGVTGAPLEEISVAMQHASDCLVELAEQKRRHPQDDLLTALVEAADEDGDRLSPRELIMLVFIMFVGGNHTTSVQLTRSVLTLFRHPDQLRVLVDKPELVPNAVEELMRFTPIGPGAFARTALEDVELSGVVVPAGTTVLPVTASANRDPAVFADPDRLDLTRANAKEHMQLGAGPHVCPGADLARTELRAALGGLLARFPTLRPAVPEAELEWEVERQGEWDLDHIIVMPRALPVTW